MKIYFDTCCYGRSLDDQTQAKIAEETIAVMTVIAVCKIAGYDIIGSDVLTFEIGNNRDDKLRQAVKTFYTKTIDSHVRLTAKGYERAYTLRTEGLGDIDSAHLAAAEAAGVNFLLTTDEDFQRICTKKNLSVVKVINPTNFLPEVERWVQ